MQNHSTPAKTPETINTPTGSPPKTPREISQRFSIQSLDTANRYHSARKQLWHSPEKGRSHIADPSPVKIPSTQPSLFTITHVAHDTLDKLLAPETAPEKKVKLKDALRRIFQPGREQLIATAEELDEMLTPQVQRLVYEKACARMYVNAIKSFLAEKDLIIEHQCIDFISQVANSVKENLNKYTDCSTLDKMFVSRIVYGHQGANLQLYPIKEIIPLLSNKTTSQLEILITQLKSLRINKTSRWTKIEANIQQKRQKIIAADENAIHRMIQDEIEQEMSRYQKEWKESRLSHILPQSPEKYRDAAIKYFHCLYQKNQLATQTTPSQTLPSEMSCDDYAELAAQEEIAFFSQQFQLNHKGVAEMQNERSNASSAVKKSINTEAEEKIKKELNEFTQDLTGDINLLSNFLSRSSQEELQRYQEEYQKEFESKENEEILFKEKLQNAATNVGETSHQIESLSPIKRRSSPEGIKKLLSQTVNLLVEDKNGNLLDKAIQSYDIEIIDYIFKYAEYQYIDRGEMLLAAMRKLERAKDSLSLLYLAAQGYFFSEPFQFYLKRHRLMSRDLSTGEAEFSIFFTESHLLKINLQNLQSLKEPAFTYLVKHASDAHWPMIHTEIQRRYATDTTNTDPQLPAAIWHRLCEVQREGEKFEKFVTYFADATSHVITAYQHDPEHYAQKIDVLLSELYTPIKSDETPQKQASRIARTLSSKDSLMATPRDYRLTFTNTTTQRIFQRQKQRLNASPQDHHLDLAQLPKVNNPHEKTNMPIANLNLTLSKTKGSREEREKRHQRKVLAREIFKETLLHLNNVQASSKHDALDELIARYEQGALTAQDFLGQISDQINTPPAAYETEALEKLGTPRISGCCAAMFGHNKTSILIRKVLTEENQALLTKYESPPSPV